MILEGPCFRENCVGPMIYEDGIYICKNCHLGVEEHIYISWIESGADGNDDLEDSYEDVPGYEELYDDEGEYVFCPDCVLNRSAYTPLKLWNNEIVCPRCGRKVSRKEFYILT